MKRFRVVLIVLVAVLCSVIAFVVKPSPYLNEISEAFGLGNCEQVCWHRIQLGKTTIAEAAQILSADPNMIMLGADKNGCPVTWSMVVQGVNWQGRICYGSQQGMSDLVLWIQLQHSPEQDVTFSLLDSLVLFGRPKGANCASITFLPQAALYNSLLLVHVPSIYTATLVFKSETQVSVQRNLPYSGLLFDPFMHVRWIRYEVGDMQPYYNAWPGFTSERFTGQPGSLPCTIAAQ